MDSSSAIRVSSVGFAASTGALKNTKVTISQLNDRKYAVV